MPFSEGRVERLQTKLANGATAVHSLTPGTGSVRVSQAEGVGDEATRAGIRFHFQWQANTGTGVAPVQAIPAVAAQWFFYLPPNAGVTAFFDVMGVWLVSGTAGAGGTLLACVCGPAQIPTPVPQASLPGMWFLNANPASERVSKLILVANQTLTGNMGFSPLAFMNPANTLLGQTQMEQRNLDGRYCISPGTGLALAVISPVGTTPLFAPYASWREYVTDLE